MGLDRLCYETSSDYTYSKIVGFSSFLLVFLHLQPIQISVQCLPKFILTMALDTTASN